MDSQRYVSIGDGNVYLVKNDPLDCFDVDISDLIDHDEIPSFGEATDIQFAGAENYGITYEEDSASTYCADDVYFIRRDGKTMPLDTSRVEEYLRNISRSPEAKAADRETAGKDGDQGKEADRENAGEDSDSDK